MLELIGKGGFVSWILIALSIITIALIVFKILHFFSINLGNIKPIKKSLNHIANDEEEIAVKILSDSKNPLANTMLFAINKINQHVIERAKELIADQGNVTLARLRSFIPWLDTIAHIAPLLGLLGTVIGMIKAFRELEAAGAQVEVTMLAGGIWEALLTTAFGLVISLVALVAVNAFESKIEKVRETMSIAISKLIELRE